MIYLTTFGRLYLQGILQMFLCNSIKLPYRPYHNDSSIFVLSPYRVQSATNSKTSLRNKQRSINLFHHLIIREAGVT